MLNSKEQTIVNKAIKVIQDKANKSNLFFTSSSAVKDYCQLQLAMSEREKFGVLFLDNQNRLIEFNIMFTGTYNSASVYPREIARLALKLNSASVLLCHNHPSDSLEASIADKNITQRIVKVLELIEVQVLDHIIVSKKGSMSFAESGLL